MELLRFVHIYIGNAYKKLMKSKKWIILGILIAVVAALAVGGYVWSRHPISMTIEERQAQIQDAVITPAGTPQITIESLQLPTQNVLLETAEPTPTLIPTQANLENPVCGGPPVMVVLALGIDENDQSDAIRLVRVDFVNKRIAVLAIPRDLWVDVPDMQDHGITEGRINATYGYGDYFWGMGNGIVLIERTIEVNYGIKVDRYATVSFSSFIAAIDALGGVDVYLDKVVDGGLVGLPVFPAGLNHLNGTQAMALARIRHLDTDVYRTRRQTMILKAVIKKALEPENWVKLPGLYVTLQQRAATTDLSPAEVNMGLCLLKKMAESDIVFYEIPQDLQKPFTTFEGGSVRLPLPGLYPFMTNFINGTLPNP